MTSTLIVRDAILAVNGVQDGSNDLHEHLGVRVEEVSRMEPELIRDCAEVLRSALGTGETIGQEMLEATTILGLAFPDLAESYGVSAVASGRRLAARLEQDSEPEKAKGVLELILEHQPGHKAAERDLQAVMRRQGMVQDLVDSYLARAKRLIKQGNSQEAIGWLREVLLLDRSRKDVARMIRDFRLQELNTGKGRKRRWRQVIFVFAFSLGATLLAMREVRVREEFSALPQAGLGDLDSMRARLHGLEGFIEANAIWHRSLQVVAERSDLRAEIDRFEQHETLRRETVRIKDLEGLEAAQTARANASTFADSGNWEKAISELRRALEVAPLDWEYRSRTEGDIAAIEEHLRENP